VDDIKILSVDGVHPSAETIASGEYSLSTSYFAVIRRDTPDDHPARDIKNWLLSDEGQDAVESAGLGRIK
jgi:phosphate transport system substrate-binding protein